MGGRGSGRPKSYCGKPETWESIPLDIREIVRDGFLVPDIGFTWQWQARGRQLAAVRIRVEHNHEMVIFNRLRRTGELIVQRVQIQTTPCHLGGQRHWLTCTRCGKRVAVLYAPNHYFACRVCQGLGYTSQKEGTGDRAIARADKIRKLLGWEAGILNGEGCKPKGMHWKTYLWLKDQHDVSVSVGLQDIHRKLGLMDKLK